MSKTIELIVGNVYRNSIGIWVMSIVSDRHEYACKQDSLVFLSSHLEKVDSSSKVGKIIRPSFNEKENGGCAFFREYRMFPGMSLREVRYYYEGNGRRLSQEVSEGDILDFLVSVEEL